MFSLLHWIKQRWRGYKFNNSHRALQSLQPQTYSLDYTQCCCLLCLCSCVLLLCSIVPPHNFLFCFLNVYLHFLFQPRYHIWDALCFLCFHFLPSATALLGSPLCFHNILDISIIVFLFDVSFSYQTELLQGIIFSFFLSLYFHCPAQYLANNRCLLHIWWMYK